MTTTSMPYPFEPRSSQDLEQGHYWAVPLSDGRYAAGVMLAHAQRAGKRDRTKILVGLLDWVGSNLPSPADLQGTNVLKKAFVHVRAIESCGSMVVGKVDREWGAPEMDLALAGTKFPGWGLLAMQYHAEMRWGDAKRMATRLKAELKGKGGCA